MKHESLLAGWSLRTWRRAVEWAGSEIDPLPIFWSASSGMGCDRLDELLAIQVKWLEAGGPMDGPSGRVLLHA